MSSGTLGALALALCCSVGCKGLSVGAEPTALADPPAVQAAAPLDAGLPDGAAAEAAPPRAQSE